MFLFHIAYAAPPSYYFRTSARSRSVCRPVLHTYPMYLSHGQIEPNATGQYIPIEIHKCMAFKRLH